ncbi:MAG: ABC transporter substrate-binding protein [Candidatus Odyssella sp.]|nr:ABC transporter substrate-binding protein [Candidatus Odyssella sp.]
MKRIAAVTLVLGLVLAASGRAGAADPPVIRIGWSVPAQTQHYVMMKKPGILKHYGKAYKADWVNFPGSVAIIQAIASKNLDAGGISIVPLARTIEQKAANLKIVADMMSERKGGFQTTWVTLESSGIKTIADLKGKTMGVAGYGSTTDLLARAILRKNGIDPDRDVKRVEVPFPVMESAMRKGDIVAGELAQPFYANAKARGGIRELFTAQEVLPVLPLLVEAFTAEFMAAHPQAVKAFLEDYVTALDFARDPKNRDEVVGIVAEVSKLPRDVLATFLLTPQDYFMSPDAMPDVEAIQKTLDFLKEGGVLKTQLDAKSMVDVSLHPRAKR